MSWAGNSFLTLYNNCAVYFRPTTPGLLFFPVLVWLRAQTPGAHKSLCNNNIELCTQAATKESELDVTARLNS